MKVTVVAGLKLPVGGIKYSNEELGITIEKKGVPDDKWEEVETHVRQVIKRIVKDYILELEESVQTDPEVLEKLQFRLAEEYETKLTKARDMIIKLEEELKQWKTQ